MYIRNPGHMTKMATMPIYGKNPLEIFFSRTSGPISTKLGMKKVQVGKDQEKAQSEKDSHSKNRGGKKPN